MEHKKEVIPCSMTSNNIEECSNLAVRLHTPGPGGAAGDDCQRSYVVVQLLFFSSSPRPLLYQDIPPFLLLLFFLFLFLLPFRFCLK